MKITLEAAKEALRAVAAENPSRKNGVCVLVDEKTGKPHCIVGRALDRIGVPTSTLQALDGPGERLKATLPQVPVDDLEFEEDALELFEHAQQLADGDIDGMGADLPLQLPWGEVVDRIL